MFACLPMIFVSFLIVFGIHLIGTGLEMMMMIQAMGSIDDSNLMKA